MRSPYQLTTLLALLPVVACADLGASGSQSLAVECAQGGKLGAIEVEFSCDSVDVDSCKDISNVVLEFADGSHEKIDDLSGTSGSFSGSGDNEGKEVVGVWVKAGNNSSGDGPGYGQRFDSPGGLCEPELECEQGGKVGYIEVDFTCEEACVSSCKDISNVVLELSDGSHVKFDDQSGNHACYAAPDGLTIVGAWVKAGDNASGDGPGYGERFDSSETCDAEDPPADDPPADDPPADEDC
jgi:hypothetical protein